MLEDLGNMGAAKTLREALARVVEKQETVTPDIGGQASTTEFVQAIIKEL